MRPNEPLKRAIEQRMNPSPAINRILLSLLLLAVALSWEAAGSERETVAAIGQPTIFWVDGQWQTFQSGRWIPYAAATKDVVVQPEIPTALEPDIVQTNYFMTGYRWGF